MMMEERFVKITQAVEKHILKSDKCIVILCSEEEQNITIKSLNTINSTEALGIIEVAKYAKLLDTTKRRNE